MKPLDGRRVLVTRAVGQATQLSDLLQSEGAVPVLFPTLAFCEVADPSPLLAALARLETYAWLGFTSANAVRFFWDRFSAGGSTGLPPSLRVAAIGPATAEALRAHGAPVHAVATEHLGERLAGAMGEVAGLRVLLPRAAGAGPELVAALRLNGARVDDVAIYRSVPAEPGAEARAELARGVAAATFTSGSTVRHFMALTGGAPAAALRDAVVACLGPPTAAAARAAGLTVQVQPREHTLPALVAALAAHFAQPASPPWNHQ